VPRGRRPSPSPGPDHDEPAIRLHPTDERPDVTIAAFERDRHLEAPEAWWIPCRPPPGCGATAGGWPRRPALPARGRGAASPRPCRGSPRLPHPARLRSASSRATAVAVVSRTRGPPRPLAAAVPHAPPRWRPRPASSTPARRQHHVHQQARPSVVTTARLSAAMRRHPVIGRPRRRNPARSAAASAATYRPLTVARNVRRPPCPRSTAARLPRSGTGRGAP